MKSYLKIMSWIENAIVSCALVVMLVVAFLNVIMRKFTSVSFAFTEELVSPLFILVTLVGAAALARTGGHVGLSILTDLFPKKIQPAFKVFSALVSFTFSAVLFYYGIIMVQGEMRSGITTAALMWPEWVFGSFIPIGAFFMCLEFINFGVLALRKPIEAEGSELAK